MKCQLGKNILQGKNSAILDELYTANRRPFYGSVSLIGRINRSWDQRVESGVASLIVTLSDSPGGNVACHPQILDFVGLKVLNPQRDTVARRHSKDPTELQTMVALGILNSLFLKTRRQEGHSLGRAIVLNQQVEEGREATIFFSNSWYFLAQI